MVKKQPAIDPPSRRFLPGSRVAPGGGGQYIPFREAPPMPQVCLVQCFNCLSDFDALEAIWCSCNPQRPTKVCPFCLGCFCAAGEEFKEAFWRDAPETLREETRTLAQSRMLIGEMLVRAGVITTTQLLSALNLQKTDGRRLGEILVDSGSLPPERLERFLHSQHTVAAVDLARARVDAMMLRRLGVDQCLEERILPLEAEAFRDRHIMTLVMADPSNSASVERVMAVTGYQVIPGVAAAGAIEAAIRSIFPQGSASPAEGIAEVSRDAQRPEDSDAVKMLGTALKRRASHLQIQNQAGALSVSYRIDGVLYLDRSRTSAEAAAAMAACKAVVGLAESGPQVSRAGRADISIDGTEHQVIVRSRAGPDGEELSAKILNPVTFPPRLDDLGMPDSVIEKLRMALECKSGLILVSSPPFSGGTSTVYALVMEIASQGRPLFLLESPREVSLTDVTQWEFFPEVDRSFEDAVGRATGCGAEVVAITASDGVNFHDGLDKLSESMLLICRVEAMTLSGSLMKLAAAGYPPAALSNRGTVVVHQRMVRKICAACRAQVSTAEQHASDLGLSSAEAAKIRVWQGNGCETCAPTPGLRGRVPLAQLLKVTPAVARAVATRSAGAVKAACLGAGIAPLMQEALNALAAGLTTPAEIARRKLD